MAWSGNILGFDRLQQRLIERVREQVRNGAVTERSLARRTHLSQPHLHNVLKGKRFLSLAATDTVLRELNLDVLDLLDPTDLREWHRRQ
jgi:hypothetical protein